MYGPVNSEEPIASEGSLLGDPLDQSLDSTNLSIIDPKPTWKRVCADFTEPKKVHIRTIYTSPVNKQYMYFGFFILAKKKACKITLLPSAHLDGLRWIHPD